MDDISAAPVSAAAMCVQVGAALATGNAAVMLPPPDASDLVAALPVAARAHVRVIHDPVDAACDVVLYEGDGEQKKLLRVLDIEADNVPSTRLAERLGAERRSPARVKRDRSGTARTLVVYVVPLAG